MFPALHIALVPWSHIADDGAMLVLEIKCVCLN